MIIFDIKRRPVLCLKHDVAEAGFCFHFQLELTQISLSPETESSYFYLAHLRRFHIKAETESSLRKVVFSNKGQDDAKYPILYIDRILSQTCRS
jgi:hypothetical protein